MRKVAILPIIAIIILTGCGGGSGDKNLVDEKQNLENHPTLISDETFSYVHPFNPVIDDDHVFVKIKNDKIYSVGIGLDIDGKRYQATNFLTFPVYFSNATKIIKGKNGDNYNYMEMFPILTQQGIYRVQYDTEVHLYKFGDIIEQDQESIKYKVPSENYEDDLIVTLKYSKKDLSGVNLSSIFNKNISLDSGAFPQGAFCLTNIQSYSNKQFLVMREEGQVSEHPFEKMTGIFGSYTRLTSNINHSSDQYDNGFTTHYFWTNLINSYSTFGLGYLGYPDVNHAYDFNRGMSGPNLDEYKAKCQYYNSIAYNFIKENLITQN